LPVTRDGERFALDFPSRPGAPVPVTPELTAALNGLSPREVLRARDLMAVLESADQVRDFQPVFTRVAALDTFGFIITAPGGGPGVDFVSRFFAPRKGVPEDPATGSSHCTLVPYWSARLGKPRLHAQQLSQRGGELYCELRADRVTIAGQVVEYLTGEITV
jgi:predicted PhzF superfamily epimerase YddE/YHI9